MSYWRKSVIFKKKILIDMKVSNVKYLKDYFVLITLDDGLFGTIDLSDLVTQGIFSVLKDKEEFSKIYATDYSLAWSEELEIDIAEIYSEISGKNPGNFFNTNITYASN